MKKYLPFVIIVVALIAVFFVFEVYWPQSSAPKINPAVTENVSSTPSSTSTDSAVKKVPIPQGSQTYQIMQAAGLMPGIIQATVNPVGVNVGDTQTLTVIVSDPNPITSVVASIQTDNGTTTVPLTLAGVAALNDVAPQRYFVNSQNQLVPTDPNKENGGSNIAFAAQGDSKYTATWTVKDTHLAKYFTVFTAKDTAGNTNSAEINWTDAVCQWNGNNNFGGATSSVSSTFGSGGCGFLSNTTDGVSNGNLLINAPLSIASGSILVVTPGNTISFSGTGTLSITTSTPSGLIDFKTNMYCASSSWVTTFSSPADGTDSVVRSSLNNNVFPGQAAYFASSTLTNYGANTWNYNCASTVNKGATVIGTYSCSGSASCTNPSAGCGGITCNNTTTGVLGWATSTVPGCGVSANYYSGCLSNNQGSLYSCGSGTGCSNPYCYSGANASPQTQECN